ncbi:hypothetical protein Taro_051672 [Colocasia esculenta]|uniref:Uncharacterized protein n=1 Tax=Colocasia esculenta TaxID=4460 RepID=A0A843XGP5_COLES|nr:hypothetical protein [Colocasia esculenta]
MAATTTTPITRLRRRLDPALYVGGPTLAAGGDGFSAAGSPFLSLAVSFFPSSAGSTTCALLDAALGSGFAGGTAGAAAAAAGGGCGFDEGWSLGSLGMTTERTPLSNLALISVVMQSSAMRKTFWKRSQRLPPPRGRSPLTLRLPWLSILTFRLAGVGGARTSEIDGDSVSILAGHPLILRLEILVDELAGERRARGRQGGDNMALGIALDVIMQGEEHEEEAAANLHKGPRVVFVILEVG